MIVGLLVLLALLFLPGIWVKHVMARYRQPADRYPGTGASFARHLLDTLGMEHVTVERTEAGDHYDPARRAVRLSPPHHDACSLVAVTVAAHEVGHAVQHHDGYRLLDLRTRLAGAAGPLARIGAVAVTAAPLVGVVFRTPAAAGLALGLGVVGMAASSLLHLATLPVEWDASFARALPLLTRGGYLKDGDLPHARRILRAAALTYVAASLFSLLNLWRWMRLLR